MTIPNLGRFYEDFGGVHRIFFGRLIKRWNIRKVYICNNLALPVPTLSASIQRSPILYPYIDHRSIDLLAWMYPVPNQRVTIVLVCFIVFNHTDYILLMVFFKVVAWSCWCNLLKWHWMCVMNSHSKDHAFQLTRDRLQWTYRMVLTSLILYCHWKFDSRYANHAPISTLYLLFWKWITFLEWGHLSSSQYQVIHISALSTTVSISYNITYKGGTLPMMCAARLDSWQIFSLHEWKRNDTLWFWATFSSCYCSDWQIHVPVISKEII